MIGRRAPRRTAEDGASDGDGTVLRLAVLLQAGITPMNAWHHLAHSGDRVAAAVESRVRAPGDLADAIGAQGGTWRDVACAWRIAQVVGAPLAESLRGIAEALRDAQRSRDEARIALAEPAGTARLMAWLPLVAVALGALLGFDTLRILVTSPFGIGCAAAGLALMFAAHRWSMALVRRAQPPEAIPGIHADLLAIALSGGVSLTRAEQIVAAARRADLDGEEDAEGEPGDEEAPGDGGGDETSGDARARTAAILRLSTSAGVPAVELLRAAAVLERDRARTDGRTRAARLSSRLLIPLGVCTLPAFLLLGVAPMLLSVLTSTPLTL